LKLRLDTEFGLQV